VESSLTPDRVFALHSIEVVLTISEDGAACPTRNNHSSQIRVNASWQILESRSFGFVFRPSLFVDAISDRPSNKRGELHWYREQSLRLHQGKAVLRRGFECCRHHPLRHAARTSCTNELA
jgi:hypothetical protein